MKILMSWFFKVQVLLLACLLVLQGSAQCVVLCVGEDGHLAVVPGCPGDMSRNNCPAPSSVSDTETCCEDCLDIPIHLGCLNETAIRTHSIPLRISVADTPSVHVPLTANTQSTVESQFSTSPPISFFKLTEIRTTVLLI
ncbi:MAG: hypothetical protein ABIH23_21690 [bacterium]